MATKTLCYGAFFGFVFFFSCEETSTKCTYAQGIAVEQGCYDPVKGLRFVALGLDRGHTDLVWEIHVLNNLSTGWTPDDIEIEEFAGESFTIPDSVLLDHIHVLAQVKTDCDGTYLHSNYFSFIRIRTNNCTIWVDQAL